METELFEKLRKEADELGITFSEHCRIKLRGKTPPVKAIISGPIEIIIQNQKEGIL